MPASISVLYTSGLFLKQQCVLIAVAWDETLSQVLRRTFFSSTDLNCPEGAHETRTIGVTDGPHSWQVGASERKRRNFDEAAQWVSNPGTAHPFSFDSVCDALEIDPELLRSRLRVLTVRSANSARRPALARLRLKEWSRRHQLSANRLRQREHVLIS